MPDLVIVQTTKNLKHVARLNNSGYLVISSSIEIQNKLKKYGINSIKIGDNLDNFDTTSRSFSLLHNILHYKVNPNETFKEWLQIDGFLYWWIIEILLFHEVKATIRYIESIERSISRERPGKIISFSEKPAYNNIIKHIAESKNISFTSIETKHHGHGPKWSDYLKQHSLNNWVVVKYIIKFIVSRTICKPGQTEELPGVLIISHPEYLNRRAPGEGNKDVMYAEIIQEIERRNIRVRGIDTDSNIFKDIKNILVKTIYEPGKWTFVQHYLSWDVFEKSNESYQKLLEKNREIRDERLLAHACVYNGIPLENIIDNIIRQINLSYPSLAYFECTKNYLKNYKPSLVLLYCEQCGFGRLNIIANKMMNVPSFGIQHAAITTEDKYYMFAKDDIDTHSNGKIIYNTIPDVTAVHGSSYKNVLTKESVYPDESVVITGATRYDELAKSKGLFKKEELFKKMHLDPGKKLVVFTTQTNGLPKELNIKNFNAVYGAMKQLSDTVQLVIKLHPQEKNISLHKSMAKQFGVKPHIIKFINLYELLFACDVMITFCSTTALEATMLDRPVIILNLSGEKDTGTYVEDGVALGVYNENEMIPTIKQLLDNDDILSVNRKNFVDKYVYKNDGKATERIVDQIQKMAMC